MLHRIRQLMHFPSKKFENTVEHDVDDQCRQYSIKMYGKDHDVRSGVVSIITHNDYITKQDY